MNVAENRIVLLTLASQYCYHSEHLHCKPPNCMELGCRAFNNSVFGEGDTHTHVHTPPPPPNKGTIKFHTCNLVNQFINEKIMNILEPSV